MSKAILSIFVAGMLGIACPQGGDSPRPRSAAKPQTAGAGTLVLKGGRLRIVSASRGSTYVSDGFAYKLPQMKEGEEVLTVIGDIVSGKPSEEDLDPWLTDKSGTKVSEKPVELSKGGQRTWLFNVPVSVGAVVLHFPGGASLPLAPFLKKTP